jgi:adenosyl cobinamide kinase/adenosyl cobinamide phosphate guanylyltransferase
MTAAVTLERDYDYRNPDGTLYAIKHRREFDDQSKTFWWKRADGTVGLNGQSKLPMPLYRSEKIDDDWVVIAEGGKAAEALAQSFPKSALGTDNAASTPDAEALKFLVGKQVFLWPDNDDAGNKHMRNVAERLRTLGVEDIRMIDVSDLPSKADAADVHPEMFDSYLDGAQPYETPAHEQSSKPHIYNMSDMKRMFLDTSEAKWEAQQSGHRLNLLWGFPKLDEITDGIQPGLIAIHGQPATGKTAWASQIAQQCNAPVLYLTAEMSVRALLKRMVARSTNTPMRQLLSATLSSAEEEKLIERTLNAQPRLRFIDGSTQPIGLDYLRQTMTELKAQDEGGHALLIIDSLHTWINQFMAEHPEMEEFKAISHGVVTLNEIANDLNIPILIVCERNGKDFKEAGLNSIAYGRVVAYRSSMVFSLDKAEEQSDPHGTVKDVTLSVLKNREGVGDGTVTFSFHGSVMKFEEL